MKGVPGLLLAVGLGVVGAFCNWMYLAQKGQALDRIAFVGVAEDAKINPGDKFRETDFQKILVPRNNLGGLEAAAYKWEVLSTLIGVPATKSYSPGEIVLRQFVVTPPDLDVKKLLAQDERVLWIPVDTRTFVPSLVNAGDQVSFIVPRLGRGGPTLAPSPADESEPRLTPAVAGPEKPIGPFRILALGNRLGKQEVLKAAGITPSQENVMAIAVKIVDGQLDPRGQQISDLLRLTNFQQVQVLLHPPPEHMKKGE